MINLNEIVEVILQIFKVIVEWTYLNPEHTVMSFLVIVFIFFLIINFFVWLTSIDQ